jgi:hypothetical protein
VATRIGNERAHQPVEAPASHSRVLKWLIEGQLDDLARRLEALEKAG